MRKVLLTAVAAVGLMTVSAQAENITIADAEAYAIGVAVASVQCPEIKVSDRDVGLAQMLLAAMSGRDPEEVQQRVVVRAALMILTDFDTPEKSQKQCRLLARAMAD